MPAPGTATPCGGHNLRETLLEQACADVLDIDEFDPDIFEQRVERIEIPGPNLITFHILDSTVIERGWQSKQRAKAWSKERRAAWGEYQKQRWTDEERAKRGEQTRKRATPESRAAFGEKMRQWYANPDNKAKHQAVMDNIRQRKKCEGDA